MLFGTPFSCVRKVIDALPRFIGGNGNHFTLESQFSWCAILNSPTH